MRKLTRRAAVTVAATGMAVAAGVVTAQPALAYNCRIVIAQDMRHFQSSTGDTLSAPRYLYRGQVFRSYGVSNGRFSIGASTPNGGYASGWVSANGDYSNLYYYGC